MAKSCTIKNDSTIRAKKFLGEKGFNLMAEYGMAGQSFDVKSVFSGKIVASHLYQDILNHPSLRSLSKEDQAMKAFEMYLEVYSDKFIEKNGDWINDKDNFKVVRYPDTGEPRIDSIFKPKKNVSKEGEALDKSLEFLKGTISDLENTLLKLESKASTEEDEVELEKFRRLIDIINDSIDKNKVERGIKGYLRYLQSEKLSSILNSIAEAKLNPEEGVSSYFINSLFDFLAIHKSNIQKLHSALSSSKELYALYKSELEGIIKEVHDGMTEIESFAEDKSSDIVQDKAAEMYGDKYTKDEVKGWFKRIKDIGVLPRWAGIPANVSDPVIRMIVELVRKIDYMVNDVVRPSIDNLIDKQVALNKAGFKDMSIFNEKYKGKKTGFLISEKNWGELHSAKEEAETDLIKIYEVETFDQVLTINEELSEKDKKTDKRYLRFKRINEEFNKKYYVHGKANPPVNEEFVRLMKNEAFADYYNALYNVHVKAKSRLPSSHRNGINTYMLPQIRRDYLESIKSEGIKGGLKVAKRKRIELVKKTDEDVEFGDVKKDKNGNIVKLVPIHYTTRLSNQEELSDDITSMYASYYHMAENFRQVTESIDDIELIQRAIDGRETKTKRAAGLTEDFIAAQLYGQSLKDLNVKLGGNEYNLSKLLNIMLVKYPSSVNMAGNLPVTVSGFLKSRIDTQIENIVGKFTTFNSAKQATAELTRQLPRVLAELANKKKTNKLDLLLRHAQVDDIMQKAYRNLNLDTKAGRMANSDLVYATMMPTGYVSIATLALSVYYNYRLVDGEFMTEQDFKRKHRDSSKKWSDYKGESLYDAYTAKNGKFEVKDEYRKYISKDFEYFISKRITILSGRLEGKTSSIEKGAMSRNVLGRAVMLHRSWIPQLAGVRFKSKGFDPSLDEWTEGFYKTVGRVIFNQFELVDGTMRFKIAKWNELEEFEKRNAIRFIADATALLAMYILAQVINNIADDDEEDKWFLEYSAYQVNRLLLEQKAFWSPGEFFNLLKSPAAAINQWQKIMNMGGLLFHGNDIIESGQYKDMHKWQRFVIQQGHLKNLYEIQYPKSKNSFLKSQML